MNVYDFDYTIYNGDSTVDFWKFCLRKHPYALLSLIPSVVGFGLYLFRIIDKTKFKQMFYTFLKYIPSIDDELSLFWEEKESKIQSWYIAGKKDDDIIISASPYFLLKPICDKLGVRVIASIVEKHTGVYTGENCYGDEKVKRFQSEFPCSEINEFYSDSISDKPLADLSKIAFLVLGDKIIEWEGHENG